MLPRYDWCNVCELMFWGVNWAHILYSILLVYFCAVHTKNKSHHHHLATEIYMQDWKLTFGPGSGNTFTDRWNKSTNCHDKLRRCYENFTWYDSTERTKKPQFDDCCRGVVEVHMLCWCLAFIVSVGVLNLWMLFFPHCELLLCWCVLFLQSTVPLFHLPTPWGMLFQ